MNANFMRHDGEKCEICHGREAAVFMVVRQDPPVGEPHVAKAHVCVDYFELTQAQEAVVVEAVSLQENSPQPCPQSRRGSRSQ